MVVGTIVGASIFVQPSEVSRAVPTLRRACCSSGSSPAPSPGSARASAPSWRRPSRETGGVYVFLREMFSPAVGFLWGWAMFWSMHSGIIAAIAMVFARYVGGIVPLGDAGIRLVAVAGILVLSAVNYVGVRPGSAVQTGADDRQGRCAIVVLLVAAVRDRRTSHVPASARARHRGRAASCARWSPACSRSAAGTWSPTRPKRRAIPSARFRAR